MMFTDKWSLDSTLQLYRQQFESGLLFTRLVPTFRTAYQIRKTLNFDLDVGYEVNHSRIAEQSSDGRRKFFSLGFRWDF